MLYSLLASALIAAPELKLLTYGGEQKFSVMNDPVMGGQSHSTYDAASGNFTGTCAIVPFLKAPGFCKVATSHGLFHPEAFPDASKYIDGALYIVASSPTASYTGFKVEFTAKNVTRPRPGQHHAAPSFKASFAVPAGNAATPIKVPFNQFSVDWSEYTGNCDTKDPTGEQHVCCSAAHPEVCPKDYHLAKMTGFAVWAEGIEGEFEIDLKQIWAGPL